MKFELKTVGYFYNSKDKHVDNLKQLGFEFEKIEKERIFCEEFDINIDNDKPVFAELNDLYNLVEFNKKIGYKLIVDGNSITIFDDHL